MSSEVPLGAIFPFIDFEPYVACGLSARSQLPQADASQTPEATQSPSGHSLGLVSFSAG